MHFSRLLRHRTAVAGGTGLLLAAAVSCGPTDPAGSGKRAGTLEDAVEKLTAQESATVVARLDGSPREIRALLAETGHGRERRAKRLADGELTVALEADRPLRELDGRYGGTRLTASVNLGDQDVVGYKSLGDTVYVRLLLKELAREGHLAPAKEQRLRELVTLADELPGSLGPVKRLLRGGWVRFDAADFEDFGWAVERLPGLAVSGDEARGAGSLLDGRAVRGALGGLERVLTQDSSYATTDDSEDGTQRMTVVMPASQVAEQLAPVLAPLGLEIDASEVPSGEITADALVRRGALAELTMDLGALAGEGATHLPLRLTFSSGDALSPKQPRKSLRLRPQDLLATVLYARMRADEAAVS